MSVMYIHYKMILLQLLLNGFVFNMYFRFK